MIHSRTLIAESDLTDADLADPDLADLCAARALRRAAVAEELIELSLRAARTLAATSIKLSYMAATEYLPGKWPWSLLSQ